MNNKPDKLLKILLQYAAECRHGLNQLAGHGSPEDQAIRQLRNYMEDEMLNLLDQSIDTPEDLDSTEYELRKLFASYATGVSAGLMATRPRTVEDAERHLQACIDQAKQLITKIRIELTKKYYEELHEVHMAHDWNDMSPATRDLLEKWLHNYHKLKATLKKEG